MSLSKTDESVVYKYDFTCGAVCSGMCEWFDHTKKCNNNSAALICKSCTNNQECEFKDCYWFNCNMVKQNIERANNYKTPCDINFAAFHISLEVQRLDSFNKFVTAFKESESKKNKTLPPTIAGEKYSIAGWEDIGIVYSGYLNNREPTEKELKHIYHCFAVKAYIQSIIIKNYHQYIINGVRGSLPFYISTDSEHIRIFVPESASRELLGHDSNGYLVQVGCGFPELLTINKYDDYNYERSTQPIQNNCIIGYIDLR